MDNIGILDPKGENKNPLTNENYSDNYLHLASVWSKFPAYKNAIKHIQTIKDNDVTLVVSGTGSGKTVLFPKYALHAFDYDAKIAVTLPKQLLTISAAKYSAETLDVKLGEEVGYKYRGSPKSGLSRKTKLLYVTDGTIVATLLNDPMISRFDSIIIDEAHERKINIDFMLYLLREALYKRPELKIIIMSATINVNIFRSYFSDFKYGEIEAGEQSHYPIKSIYEPTKEYISKGVEIIRSLIPERKDILFFVTSANEAYEVCRSLKDRGKVKVNTKDNIFCIEVFAGIDDERQKIAQDKDIYKKIGYDVKVVVATNVAESSLTIDGIKYVIDSGFELQSSYDPIKNATRLDKLYITKAQVKQRMGRSGRTEPGICYHLYSKEQYEDFDDFPKPSIKKENITKECLKLLETFDIESLIDVLMTKFIEPPNEINVKTALNQLKELNLVADKITELGKIVNRIGISTVQISLAIVYGFIYNCHKELIKIGILIESCKSNIDGLFNIPKDDFDRYKKIKDKFKHKSGDHLSLLKIYDGFEKKQAKNDKNKLFKWCNDRFLKFNLLINVSRKIKTQIENINIDKERIYEIFPLLDKKIEKKSISKRILFCLYQSHRIHNVADVIDNVKIGKNSFMKMKVLKGEVIFHQILIMMGKPNLQIVSSIR